MFTYCSLIDLWAFDNLSNQQLLLSNLNTCLNTNLLTCFPAYLLARFSYLTYLLTHLLTRSHTHLNNCLLTHLITYSFINLLIFSIDYLLSCSLHSLNLLYLLNHLFTKLFTQSRWFKTHLLSSVESLTIGSFFV